MDEREIEIRPDGWEYLALKATGEFVIQDILNEQGAKGWEHYETLTDLYVPGDPRSYMVFLFKRRVSARVVKGA